MKENDTTILKVLVGSRAHGLHTEESDFDFRGVYVTPTTSILSLGHKYSGSHWIEGEKQDQTAWEIGHFLHLATKCNPTILEVFKAPVDGVGGLGVRKPKPGSDLFLKDLSGEGILLGAELQDLFPYVWNPKNAFDAFCGYGGNQEKKMRLNHLDRWKKYAVAYLRTLWNLNDLLGTGDFSLEVTDKLFKSDLLEIKNGEWTQGAVIDRASQLKKAAEQKLIECKQEPDKDKVNEFLLKIRKEFWQ